MKTFSIIAALLLGFACASTGAKTDSNMTKKSADFASTAVAAEFSGKCAYAVALGNLTVPGSSLFTHTSSDGKVFHFSNQETKDLYLADENGHRVKAYSAWKASGK